MNYNKPIGWLSEAQYKETIVTIKLRQKLKNVSGYVTTECRSWSLGNLVTFRIGTVVTYSKNTIESRRRFCTMTATECRHEDLHITREVLELRYLKFEV